jgi:hypothetical protein
MEGLPAEGGPVLLDSVVAAARGHKLLGKDPRIPSREHAVCWPRPGSATMVNEMWSANRGCSRRAERTAGGTSTPAVSINAAPPNVSDRESLIGSVEETGFDRHVRPDGCDHGHHIVDAPPRWDQR